MQCISVRKRLAHRQLSVGLGSDGESRGEEGAERVDVVRQHACRSCRSEGRPVFLTLEATPNPPPNPSFPILVFKPKVQKKNVLVFPSSPSCSPSNRNNKATTNTSLPPSLSLPPISQPNLHRNVETQHDDIRRDQAPPHALAHHVPVQRDGDECDEKDGEQSRAGEDEGAAHGDVEWSAAVGEDEVRAGEADAEEDVEHRAAETRGDGHALWGELRGRSAVKEEEVGGGRFTGKPIRWGEGGGGCQLGDRFGAWERKAAYSNGSVRNEVTQRVPHRKDREP